MSLIESPAARSALAVPPVEISSTSKPASACELDEAGLVGHAQQSAADRLGAACAGAAF